MILTFVLAITTLGWAEEPQGPAESEPIEENVSLKAGDILSWPLLCRAIANHREHRKDLGFSILDFGFIGKNDEGAEIGQPGREGVIKTLNGLLTKKDLYTYFKEEDAPTPARVLWNTADLSGKHLARANRFLLEALFRESMQQSLSETYDIGLLKAAEKHRLSEGMAEALAFCKKMIERDPWLKHTRLKYARLCLQNRQTDDAVRELDKLVELQPGFAPGLLARARLLLAEGGEAVAKWQEGDDQRRAKAITFAKMEAAEKAARLKPQPQNQPKVDAPAPKSERF
jgi:tetratricopeptide (TPR) repeat protein